MHVGEHGDDGTRHAAPVGGGSAAGARVCEREVQRAEVMGKHWGCRGGGFRCRFFLCSLVGSGPA